MRFLLVGLGMLALAGCVTPGTTVLTPEQVIVGATAFDGIERTAANYLRLPLCVSGGSVVCRTQSVSASLVKAVRNARHARSQLEAYVRANPSQPVPVNLYQAMSVAITSLRNVMAANNIN